MYIEESNIEQMQSGANLGVSLALEVDKNIFTFHQQRLSRTHGQSYRISNFVPNRSDYFHVQTTN